MKERVKFTLATKIATVGIIRTIIIVVVLYVHVSVTVITINIWILRPKYANILVLMNGFPFSYLFV
jgi:hypothetical protein